MNGTSTIAKIALALSKAQKKIGTATKGAANPFFKSKYADLGSVMEACKEALNSEGITVLQPVTTTPDGKHAVETVLLHESGEYIASTMTLELTKTNMQDLGSAITYARRYSLQSLVFIPSEDDDGEKAMQRTTTPVKSAPVATATTDAAPKRTAASFAKKTTTAPAKAPEAAPTVVTPPVTNGNGTAAASEWEN